jgi:hypothetical protein
VWFRAPRELRVQADINEMESALVQLLDSAPAAVLAMLTRFAQQGGRQALHDMLCYYQVRAAAPAAAAG